MGMRLKIWAKRNRDKKCEFKKMNVFWLTLTEEYAALLNNVAKES